MKKIISVSLGSSKRNHVVQTKLLNEDVVLERIGTDGDLQKAIRMIQSMDGKVDAIGLGGIDLYIYGGKKRYVIQDALKLKNAAKTTPVVDGSGLKNTLERRVIEYLAKNTELLKSGTKVLLVSAVDRFGMAEALVQAKCDVLFGDLVFGLGVPVGLRTLTQVAILAQILLPILTRMPFEKLYPTGEKQEKIEPKHEKYYQWADVIAGDFHFIRRHLPAHLPGKTVLTNTVTKDDVELLKSRGISCLVTTTPEFEGRSFGTNVLEGLFVALSGQKLEQLSEADYLTLLEKLDFKPRIERLERLTG